LLNVLFFIAPLSFNAQYKDHKQHSSVEYAACIILLCASVAA